MTKDDLLKNIAQTAYNVGYGAKKHFATLDIVEKVPGFLNFIALSIGALALYRDNFAAKDVSATLLVMAIIGLYIGLYVDGRKSYEEKGVYLTNLLNQLKLLYYNVKSSALPDFSAEEAELFRIQQEYNANSFGKQILFSDWYAHYKFFWQQQIDWIDEQLHFSLWRDKIPLSAYPAALLLLAFAVSFVRSWCISHSSCG